MPNPTAEDIAQATVVLSLDLGAVRNRRKIDSDSDVIETEVDRSMLHISKELFDAAELKACYGFQAELKWRVRHMTVPSLMKGGVYLVKVENVEKTEALLTKAKADFEPLVRAFADVVDQRRDESKERLGPAFNEADYPNHAQVLDAFFIKWRWLTMTTPSSLKKISATFFEREAKKAEVAMQSIVENAETLLLDEMSKLAEHMVDRLTPDEDGKPKTFRDSLTSNVSEFLVALRDRNISNNPAIEAQAERIQQLILGIDPKTLRKNDRLREDVASGFKAVRESIDALVISRPRRYMSLGDEQ